ncbi:MAG: hypothetical protein ACT4RN_07390 [Pseudonocardia sp.]
MPPTAIHLNGSVNLPDAEAVMREVASRVPAGLRRIPDGETGDRGNWILFQLQRFLATPGIEEVPATGEGYDGLPKVRMAAGGDATSWPDLGYADVYRASYETFGRLRKEGAVPDGVRFQAQYPTPLAPVAAFFVPEDHQRVGPSYERALLADLDRLVSALPHDDVAVQWDVAVEIGMLVAGMPLGAVVDGLVRCVDAVPSDVPAGLHLCYGDYQHRHFAEPTSLRLQVELANAVSDAASRRVDWYSFTVPQSRRDAAFFAPLAELRPDTGEEIYLALVPYHPDRQEGGTTGEQIALVDRYLDGRPWGICTECGMGRAEVAEIPRLLDLHREILAG